MMHFTAQGIRRKLSLRSPKKLSKPSPVPHVTFCNHTKFVHSIGQNNSESRKRAHHFERTRRCMHAELVSSVLRTHVRCKIKLLLHRPQRLMRAPMKQRLT